MNRRDQLLLLLKRGSSSWYGPSPRAAQSRWAVEARRREQPRAGRLVAAAVGVPMVAGLLVALVVAAQSLNFVGEITRVVSQGFAGPGSTPITAPSPAASPSPAVTGAAAAPTSPRPRTWFPPMGPEREDRWPTPRPSPGPVTPPTPVTTPVPSPAPSSAPTAPVRR